MLTLTVRIGTSVKVALKNCWNDFDRQFGDMLERFRDNKARVEEEAGAAAIEDGQIRLQRLESLGKS
jgi:hypothetical protein